MVTHHERRRDPRPPGRAARRRPRRARRAGAGVRARGRRRDAAALLRRRAHPQPPGRRRHLDRPDRRAPPAPTSPGPRSRRCCARWPTRSTRWSRRTGARAAPGPAGRRRRPQPRASAPWRPPILGRAGHPPAAGGVRRPRRRPPGRLGAVRRGRAARLAAAERRDRSRPTRPPAYASAMPRCATAPGPRPTPT